MTEFLIKHSDFELRSCNDPYIMAEIVYMDRAKKEEVVIATYEYSDEDVFILKIDEKKSEYYNSNIEAFLKLESLLISMSVIFLSKPNTSIITGSTTNETYQEVKKMIDEYKADRTLKESEGSEETEETEDN